MAQARIKTLKELNTEFNFSWESPLNIPNPEVISNLEAYIENIAKGYVGLDMSDQKALGELCYKLGSYYLHIKRSPNEALQKLANAERYLKGKELSWTQVQIAFCYQQLLFKAKKEKSSIKESASLAESYYSEVLNLPIDKADFDSINLHGFAHCVKALTEYELGKLDSAIKSYRLALDIYEHYNLCGEQYARAKNRYAQFLVEKQDHYRARVAFTELEHFWSTFNTSLNPYAARFYVSYADYLLTQHPIDHAAIFEKYKKAHKILSVIEGEQSVFVKEIQAKLDQIQAKLPSSQLDKVLQGLISQIAELPFEARDVVIESFSTILLRGFVPISGMTVQQHLLVSEAHLQQLNALTKRDNTFKNSTDPRFVYQFAREATSAGITPVYRDAKTGSIYMALICNKRNTEMYNWSAGYTEAPLPGWRGKLLSEEKRTLQYDRKKIKDTATKIMFKVLEEVRGDWTKVEFDPARLEREFKAEGVDLPKTDFNSLHTASRECVEEIGLDLTLFPKRKTFLISYDNTLGISQGDAPGQTSNRSHQYLVYLGDLEAAPEIKAGDDVAIADWVTVSEIIRKSSIDYSVNNKPLCVYMLRGIELGLKELANYLLQQASMRKSRFSENGSARFSAPENLLADIENYCEFLKVEDEKLVYFMKYLAGDLPNKTYTGKQAQVLLSCMLETAKFFMSGDLNPDTFLSSMRRILSPLEFQSKVYSQANPVTHFVPAAAAAAEVRVEAANVKLQVNGL